MVPTATKLGRESTGLQPATQPHAIIGRFEQMALVTRFLRLSGHDDTHMFTFVGTKIVTRDLNWDITSKEFRFGHHKWVITLTREQKNLSVYIVWKNILEESFCKLNILS
jgi:hypothetical protein